MKQVLYLGIDPTHFKTDGQVIHYPIIRIVPRSEDDPGVVALFENVRQYTHIIFTSKSAVCIFFLYMEKKGMHRSCLMRVQMIVIGEVTALHLRRHGFEPVMIANNTTQEGIIEALDTLDWEGVYFLLPRSSLSRSVLVDFFDQNHIRYDAVDLYDTVISETAPIPNVESMDEIVFTSPSCVEAFYSLYGCIPEQTRCIAIGPITQAALQRKRVGL